MRLLGETPYMCTTVLFVYNINFMCKNIIHGMSLYSPLSRVICPTKFKNWRTLKSFWGIIYHICGVSLPPIPGHLELGGTQRIDILIKVILHCKMVQIGHFQRVIREVSRGCLMVPIFLTGQDMSIFR